MSSHSPDVFFPAVFGVFFFFWMLIVVLSVAATVFWIVELVDACRREYPDPNLKIVWIVVLIFSHGIGALVYFFVGKQQGWLPGQGVAPVRPAVSPDPWTPPPGGSV